MSEDYDAEFYRQMAYERGKIIDEQIQQLAALRSEVERLTRERDARPDIGVEQYRELNEWAGWQARARDGWEGRARNAEAEVARLIRVTRERDEALTLVEAVRTFGATWRDGHYLSVAEGTAEAALMNALDLFEAGRAMADPRPQRVRDTYEILANRLDRTVVELRAERDSLQRDLDQTQQWLGAAINDAWILEGAVDGARISRAQMEKVFNEQVIRDGIRSTEVVQLEGDVARLTRTNEFLLQQQAELVALVESESKRADGERLRGYERAIEVLRAKIEAAGSPLCDCEPEESPPTSPKTGERMPHHCECRAVLTAAVLIGAYTATEHAQQCGHEGARWDEAYGPPVASSLVTGDSER